MIINKLTLHNFGVYAGTNTFHFTASKPIVLIGGLNGRGKTTFLEAVLLSLYGTSSFAYSESSFSTYGKYLRSFVNNNDGTKETFIEMQFQLLSEDNIIYRIRRSWSALGERTREKIAVFRNDEEDTFLSENWPMFIENVLPSALSNFFFFDGEKIAELAVDDTDTKVKESIRSMLGLSLLDTLNNDLLRLVNRKNKEVNNEDIVKYEKLRDEKSEAEANLESCDIEIQNITAEIQKSNLELEKLRVDYVSNGGDVVEKQQDFLHLQAF